MSNNNIMKAFIDSQFSPLVIDLLDADGNHFSAVNQQMLLNMKGWQMINGIPTLQGLVRIVFTLDGNITSETFDYTKANVYSVVSTRPKFMNSDDDLPESITRSVWMQLQNIFSSSDFNIPALIPDPFNVANEYDDSSFMIIDDVMIVPFADSGSFTFTGLNVVDRQDQRIQ